MLKKLLALAIAFCAASAFAAVDVNKATEADLDGVKGVGPGLSTRIIAERKKGEFKDWSDFIDRVRGVGEGNAGKFSANGLTVNGAAYKRTAATTDTKDAKDGKAKSTTEREERRKLRDEARKQKAEEAMAKNTAQDKPASKAEAKVAAKAKAKSEEGGMTKN